MKLMQKYRIILTVLCFIFVLSCKDKTSFEGRTTKPQPVAQETPPPSQTQPPPQQKTEDVKQTPDIVPDNAVKKGSFTVYTEPKDPQPSQDYFIVVLVDLPTGTTTYSVEDLSGIVIGTDKYRQDIRYSYKRKDGFLSTFSSQKYDITKIEGNLPIENGKAKHMVGVPGAVKLVEDTIEVASILLNEKQTIKIVF